MNLTRTEKYALTVLDTYGKLSALKKRERALCLAASCVWEMQQAGIVTADKKGKLIVSAPLPEALSCCSPVYAWLAKIPADRQRRHIAIAGPPSGSSCW